MRVVSPWLLTAARSHGLVEEGCHIVDGIVETAGTLEPGAATPAAGAFQDEDIGSCRGGLDRGGDARNAVPGDCDVGFDIPARDLVGRPGVDVAVHGRIATGNSPVHWWPQ